MIRPIELTQSKVALIDEVDFEEINRYEWFAHRTKRKWYAMRNIRLPNGKKTVVYMHRIIMGSPEGVEIDHIDGDGLNNTRDNLRLATRQQNSFNSFLSKNNTSGFKGVVRFKGSKGWAAAIQIDGKRRHIGYYSTAEEAAKAYDAAAIKLYGSFAKLNFDIRKALEE